MITKKSASWDLFLEHSELPVFLYNCLTHKILNSNQHGQQLIGYDPSFLQKASFSDFLLDDFDNWKNRINLLKYDNVNKWETNLLVKDQQIKSVELKLIPIAKEDHCLISIKEILPETEQIQALKDKLSFYETILMQMPTEFAVLNANWQYLFINHNSIKDPVFRAWMIGKTDYDFCRYRNKDFTIAENRHKQYNELAKTKSKKEWIDKHLTKEGTEKFVLRKLYPYFKDGELNMNFGFGIDITERIQAEQERENLLEELTKQNEELKQFAYITSHDLKEPLRTVSGFASILKRKYADKLDNRGLEFLNFIVEGTDRMSNLLTSLKSFINVDAEKLKGKVKKVDTKLIVNNALKNLKLKIQETKTTIQTPTLFPIVKGHPEYLTLLFQNLVVNGIKFCDSIPSIRIDWQEENDYFQFAISDNGIGIKPEHQEKIFHLFNRLHKKRKDGSGIGLSICKKVVQLHKGKIWVESDGASGSTFFFTLNK